MGWYSANITKSTNFSDISYDDYKRNGMYCKSGFAFPLLPSSTTQANCTTVDYLKYKGVEIFKNESYPCDPTN